MTPTDDEYSAAELAEAVGCRPLSGLPYMDVGLLYWRWVWASRIRQHFLAALDREDDAERFDEGTGEPKFEADSWMFMYLWYGLLWAVVEALDERGVEFSNRLSEDIENLSDGLRLTRNAVFHIPSPADGVGFTRGGFHDERLTRLMRKGDGDWTPDRETVPAISRVHSVLGQLLREEVRLRTRPH